MTNVPEHASPLQLGEGVKKFQKSLCWEGGVRTFYFGGELCCWRGESCHFEVKTKTA